MRGKFLLVFLLVIFSILNFSGWLLYFMARRSLNPRLELATALLAVLFSMAIFVWVAVLWQREERASNERLKKLQEKVDAKAKQAALGELSAEMAHEIRTPLGAISGYAELLERKPAGEEEKTLLRSIISEVKNCNQVMTGFLDITNPFPQNRVELKLDQLLDETVDLARLRFSKTNVRVFRDYGELPLYRGNSEQLKQAFSNLIANAYQAMPNGGTLRLRSSMVKPQSSGKKSSVPVTGGADSAFLKIEVADTGVGIPVENMARVWTSFFTTKEDGIGLGLSIVQRVVRAHGGKIEVESKPGAGTVFILLFPADSTLQE